MFPQPLVTCQVVDTEPSNCARDAQDRPPIPGRNPANDEKSFISILCRQRHAIPGTRDRAAMFKLNRVYLISPRKMHVIVHDVHWRGCNFYIPRDGGVPHVPGGGVIDPSWMAQGEASSDFIPWSGYTHEIGSQGHQLADAGDTRYIRDQLVHDGQSSYCWIDRGNGDHHQGRLVLPA